jgi:outer membrane receptor protein involved in Fe transport
MQVGRLIGTLGACAVFLLPAPSAGAQETGDLADLVGREVPGLDDEFAFLQEEDVVFSAAKHQQKVGFSPSAVIVITRREIEESGALTLMELLRRYPAVHVYEFDPMYPTAEIRGSYQVLMLLDGREVNLELYAAPFYSFLPVGLKDIERIEIVLGPNSALYGANAVSAVINVTSRTPGDEFHADLSTAAGSHGSSLIEGILEGGTGPLAGRASLGIDRGLSWMDRDLQSKDILRTHATLRLRIPGGQLIANGGLVTGAGRVFALAGYMDCREIIMAHARADLEIADFKARVYWYGLRTRLDLDLGLVHPDMGVSLGKVPTLEFAGDTVQAEAQYNAELFADNLLIAGMDFRVTSFRSDQLVDGDILEYRLGIFLHDEHRFSERLLLTLGARFDWNNKTEPGTSPRAALVYNPAGEHFLRLSAAMAYRKPSLMETSANFFIDENPAFPEIDELFERKGISNASLQNESLAAVELGYRGALLDRALRLGADFYLGFNRNTIDFASDIRFDQTPLGPRINIAESRLGYGNAGRDINVFGVHFNAEAEPARELTLFLRGDFRHRWVVPGGGRDIWVSRLLSSAGGTLRLPFGLVVHLALVYVGERDNEIRDPVSVLAPPIVATVPVRFYALCALNYKIELGASRVDLGLALFNPFGGRFREETGTRAPDGSNFGGELLGTRAMLTARFRY